MTLLLRHQVTDAYAPVPTSDLALQVRRNYQSDVWDYRYGLRPWERVDQPFGIGWSSNIISSIRFVTGVGTTENPPEVPTAYVTDENGTSFRFYWSTDSAGMQSFFPFPTAKSEQASYVCTLEQVSSYVYKFTRKYGTALEFTMTPVTINIWSDRLIGPPTRIDTYTYARLTGVSDRLGNILDYTYAGTTDFIPTTVAVRGYSALKLTFEQTGGVITAITDPLGFKTNFVYQDFLDPVSGLPTGAKLLRDVVRPDFSITRYGYGFDSKLDERPLSTTQPDTTFYHYFTDVVSITSLRDENDTAGTTYGIDVAFDLSRFDYSFKDGYYQKVGIPRNVVATHLPEGVSAQFENHSIIAFYSTGSGSAVSLSGSSVRTNTVINALGFSRVYTWTDPAVYTVDNPPTVFVNDPPPPDPIVVYYQTMTVDLGTYGTEVYKFDPNAGLAVKYAKDLSGNETTYTHTDAAVYDFNVWISALPNTVNNFYDDPNTQTNALGDTKSFTYDALRIMTSVTDELGRKTVYAVDSLGRRTSEKIYDPSNNLVQSTDFTYDTTFPGFMTRKTLYKFDVLPTGEGNLITDYVPDTHGRIWKEIIDPTGLALTTVTTYSDIGQTLTVTDPLGRLTGFYYDNRHRLVRSTFADYTSKTLTHDYRSNKIAETNERGVVTLFEFDGLNRLKKQTVVMDGIGTVGSSPNLVTQFSYNAVSSKVAETDPNGKVTSFAYDDLQRQISTTTPAVLVNDETTPRALTTTFEYGVNSGGSVFSTTPFKPTKTVNFSGFTIWITYDALYRATETKSEYVTGGATSIIKSEYDKVGNTTKSTDPLNHDTLTAYDALNRPVLITFADSSTKGTVYTTTGLVASTTDELSRTTTFVYDGAGRKTKTISPLVDNGYGTPANAVIQNIYDDAGNIIAFINPLGAREDSIFDVRNRKIVTLAPSVVDITTGLASRPRTLTTFDPVGNVTAITDPRGNVTSTDYDAANQVVRIVGPVMIDASGNPVQPITSRQYDANGNILIVTDSAGNSVVNEYDALNRLVKTTDAEGIVVKSQYDEVGNKTALIDGKNQKTTFGYDGLKRNIQIMDPTLATIQFTFDSLNKTTRLDANGAVTQFTYDVRNRLSKITYVGRTGDNRLYAYDLAGNLITVQELPKQGKTQVRYTYDALNRVITEVSGKPNLLYPEVTHTYAYDLAGNRVNVVYGGTGRTTASTYDSLNRLLTITESGRVTTYGYDLAGNHASLTLPNGDHTLTTFDSHNRPERLETKHGTTRIQTFTNRYDIVGNVARIYERYPASTDNRTISNTYDRIYRLTGELIATSAGSTTTAYAYDPANNRATKTTAAGTVIYNSNTLNQLTDYTEGGVTTAYTYDGNGNRKTRTVGAVTDTYDYDYDNRLVTLVQGGVTYTYAYDYRTRRVERIEGGIITRIVFSGGTSSQEYQGASPNLATPTVEYQRGSDLGGGIGGILYTLRSGTLAYTHYNRRGDVTAKTDTSGTITYQALYEAFGTRTDETGSTLDRQKANTKEEDPTGLLNEGFRYRDLLTGAFITRDPLGFVDGPNMYTYVIQNPWTKWDAEGLRAQNDTEKEALKKMKTIEGDIRKNAQQLGAQAALKKQQGKKEEAEGLSNSSKKELSRANGLANSINEIEKLIDSSPNPASDPKSLKILDAAFKIWNNPKLQESYAGPGTGGTRTSTVFAGQNKCNVFLFDCLVSAGYLDSTLFHPGLTASGEKNTRPALAGKWNDDSKFNPPGLGRNSVQKYEFIGDTWSGKAAPGSVITYGDVNAAGSHAHATISLGGGWIINASDEPIYGQKAGVNIKYDTYPATYRMYRRNVRNPDPEPKPEKEKK